jgi:hypothetical protein
MLIKFKEKEGVNCKEQLDVSDFISSVISDEYFYGEEFKIMERGGIYIPYRNRYGIRVWPTYNSKYCVSEKFESGWYSALWNVFDMYSEQLDLKHIKQESLGIVSLGKFTKPSEFKSRENAVDTLKECFGKNIKILEGEWRQV